MATEFCENCFTVFLASLGVKIPIQIGCVGVRGIKALILVAFGAGKRVVLIDYHYNVELSWLVETMRRSGMFLYSSSYLSFMGEEIFPTSPTLDYHEELTQKMTEFDLSMQVFKQYI